MDNTNNTKLRRTFLAAAALEAQKSTMIHRHGCVLVHDNCVICCGHNRAFTKMSHQFSLHAEVAALHKAKRKHRFLLPDCDMYVVRLGPAGEPLKMSKPCCDCQVEIGRLGIRRVFYSAST